VPASSEKTISEASASREELEKQKGKEEEKLKEVMASLKEETSGLQQEKEVGVFHELTDIPFPLVFYDF
jgi:structural maintenance of chromosome 4